MGSAFSKKSPKSPASPTKASKLSPSPNTPLLVTGATGYLASHVIKLLLEQGYKVRGTVRSLAKKDKYQFLYDLVPAKKDNLELVEADLVDRASWSKAVEGCEYIFHIASPIPPYVPTDENELIKPAVEGTVNVLEAAVEKKAKKVVVTSSCLTIFVGNGGRVLTEADWSKEEYMHGYPKSKLKAERAAWDFYEKNKSKIQMAVVNPALILGPMFTNHGNSSESLLNEILDEKFPGVLDVNLTLVDVRDAAQAHVEAMFNKGSNGKRYICYDATYSLEDIIKTAKEEFGKHGYNIKDQKITVEEAKASDSGMAKMFAPLVGHNPQLSNERSKKEFGLKYHGLKDMVVDMGHSLIKTGAVTNKLKD